MRTTLTLDPDVQRLIEEAMHSRRASMKTVVNDAIRTALGPRQRAVPYQVEVHHSDLVGGIDIQRLNHLAVELEDDEHLTALSKAQPDTQAPEP